MAVSISLSITQNSQDASNLTSNVTVKLTASWTYGSFNRNNPSGSVTIDGTKYSFSSDFNANETDTGSEVIYKKTLDIKHNATTGKKTLSCSASFATGVSSGTVTTSKSKELTQLSTITISYNGNGGSGAPSSQSKYYDVDITLSSTKPTRTGYTFLGWSTSSTATTATYSAGGTCALNASDTLYAVWDEHKLTVNYYSNYATSAFEEALNEVGSDKNVKVWESEIYYDNDYTTYGLANYSNSTGSVYMTRTGYTATGDWGTSTSGGTLINENDTFSTGQALAKALGKDLSNGDASINVYAQWTENALTINYYSNRADYGSFQGEVLSNVKAGENVIAYTHKYYYDNAYSDGLYNIQNSEKLYLSRTGYASTLHWGTSPDGGILIDQYVAFDSGQELAEAVGKSLESGNASINLYAQWKPSGVVYIDNGTEFVPYLPYIDNGTSWDLYIAYVDDGVEWNIIS